MVVKWISNIILVASVSTFVGALSTNAAMLAPRQEAAAEGSTDHQIEGESGEAQPEKSDAETHEQDACDSLCDSHGGESQLACDDYLACTGCSDTFWECWLDGGQSPLRTKLADNGVTFANNLTSFYTGVTGGGLEQEFRFAGHGDYVMNVDFMKAGGPPGLFFRLRAEHRFGEPLGEPSGAMLPPYIASILPSPESRELYLTNVLFTQAFSENFAVFAGKLDTLDGDANAFAHGRGISQFSNTAFVVTPVGLRTIAYSTLGTGFVVLDEGEPLFTFTALNAREGATECGLDELYADGVVLAPELRLKTNFFNRPGHQLFGGTWSSRDYVSLDQDPRVLLPSIPIERTDGSWSLYWNCDQYLVVDPRNEKRGWGYFARAGIADESNNPFAWFLSAGLGGNSKLFGRDADTFGIGWYYARTSPQLIPELANVLGGIGDSQGGEVFHNFAVNSRLSITLDGQVLLPARDSVDYTLITGLRANLRF